MPKFNFADLEEEDIKPKAKSSTTQKNWEVEKQKSKTPKKSKKEIKIKTDNFRTGISNITGSSKRDKPPILKQKLIDFLESHELIKKSDRTWYWIKNKEV